MFTNIVALMRVVLLLVFLGVTKIAIEGTGPMMSAMIVTYGSMVAFTLYMSFTRA